jgi:copper homeostasis protein
MSVLLEIMTDSIESALSAQQGGADRIELCENLGDGGTTPSPGLIQMTVDLLDIDVHIMIRPRGGDFHYSDLEFKVMKNNIQFCKNAGAAGVVIGLLNLDGSVDKKRTAELVELARPMRVTFHRAFDMTEDPVKALKDLMEIGVDHILTSGQKPTALEGVELIAEVVKEAGENTIIIAGAGITEKNIKEIIEKTGVRECHSSAKTISQSKMLYKKTSLFMGRSQELGEYETIVVDSQKVRAMKDTVLKLEKAF